MKHVIIATLLIACSLTATARAGIGSKAAGELVEFVAKKFGKAAVAEGAEKLTARIVQAAARHGDDVVKAIRKVGPKAITLADDAGKNAPSVLRLVNHYGDDAVRVLSRPRGLAILGRYGDEAAEALIRHKGVAEPLVESLGAPAVKAINTLGPQAGRRLAMMAGDELATIGRTPELLAVIARYGDTAMDFVWRNKGVLAGSATLAAFLGNPEPFLSGAADLTHVISQDVVQPLAGATATAVMPMVTAAGHAIQPAVSAAAEAAWGFTLWLGGWLLLAGLALVLVGWLLNRGFFGKLLLRTGLKLAGGQIADAVRKK